TLTHFPYTTLFRSAPWWRDPLYAGREWAYRRRDQPARSGQAQLLGESRVAGRPAGMAGRRGVGARQLVARLVGMACPLRRRQHAGPQAAGLGRLWADRGSPRALRQGKGGLTGNPRIDSPLIAASEKCPPLNLSRRPT